jgi:hypothetical protein
VTKILSLVKTRDGTSPESFRDYWRDSYLPSLLALRGVKSGVVKVTHNHAFPLPIREDFPPPPWAGVGEIWFDRQSDADSFINHPELPALLAAHAGILAEVVHIPCTELPTWDLGAENLPLKMMAFFRPSKTMTRAQAQDYWTNKHVAVGLALRDSKRYAPKYIQNHVRPEFRAPKPECDFAGAPELWFYSREAALSLFTDTAKLEEFRLDEAKFSDRATTFAVMTDEQCVFARTAVRV